MKKTWIALLALSNITNIAHADWIISSPKGRDITVPGDKPTDYNEAVARARNAAGGTNANNAIGLYSFEHDEYRLDPTSWGAANEACFENYANLTLKDDDYLSRLRPFSPEILRKWNAENAKKPNHLDARKEAH